MISTIRTHIAFWRLPRVVRDVVKTHHLKRDATLLARLVEDVDAIGPSETAFWLDREHSPPVEWEASDYQRMAWERPRDAAGRFRKRVSARQRRLEQEARQRRLEQEALS